MKVFDYLIIYISNLPNLQSYKTGLNSFYKTTSLSLSSMIIEFDYLIFSNLPNLQSFETGDQSFYKTTSLSLSRMIIKFDYLIFSNLPNLQEMIIGKNCLNKWEDDLVIENYPNLEKIVVKKNSLQNWNLLKICNNEKLKIIEIEDGEEWEENGKWLNNGACFNVKNVIIESISIVLFDIFKSS